MTIIQKCINTLRTLSIDAVQQANSGHPGMPMGMADVTYILWTEYLKHNPNNPKWFDRDRFILSAGHGSILLYSLLHLFRYGVTLDDLKKFRQWGSITPGHPEVGLTPGVETTTGPLGQGFANSVGMAVSEAHLAARFNKEIKIVDHYTYVVASDGDLMEGISQEAASLAGHLRLGKLICFYDDNKITIDGSIDLTFSENVYKRFEALGWHCIMIDGHNHSQIREAIKESKIIIDKPSLILCQTKIGFGSPNKEGKSESHGAPLGNEEVTLTKVNYGLTNTEPFFIEADVINYFKSKSLEAIQTENNWNKKLKEYIDAYPVEYEKFLKQLNREFTIDDKFLPKFNYSISGLSTRVASGHVLDSLVNQIPQLIGGSADLTPSNNSKSKNFSVLDCNNYAGRYIHYGIREHAMAGIMNGIALHGCLIPFGATFLIFSDYCRPPIRIAALSHIPVIYVFTHDSIGLGEDGPTHQPIEQLASLRAIPNITVLRPADANETVYAWKVAIQNSHGPTILVLSRQNLPIFDRSIMGSADGVQRGAYILVEYEYNLDAIIMASGSEVSIAVEASLILKNEGIIARVVSVPSIELFEKQTDEYRESVLPAKVQNRVVIEAGIPLSWFKYVNNPNSVISINRFGASAPGPRLYKEFNLTSDAIVEIVKKQLE
jgi:transketolase